MPLECKQDKGDKKVAKESAKKIWCRMGKGWTAYVRGYKTYTKKYDDIEFGEGTKKKKEETVQQGAVTKTIIKY